MCQKPVDIFEKISQNKVVLIIFFEKKKFVSTRLTFLACDSNLV